MTLLSALASAPPFDGAEDEKESDDEGKVDLSIIKEIREEQKVGLYDY